MARTGRFLLVTWPGGGNVNPLLALGARMVRRGHALRVLGPKRGLAERFAAEGIAYRGHRSGAEWTGGAPIRWPTPPTPAQRLAYLHGLAADVRTELQREPADVVVVDYMQPAALCAAEQSGLPFVAFVHTLYQRVALAAHTPMQLGADTAGINALRAELGLAAVQRLPELLDRATQVLVVTAPELDRKGDPLPDNVVYSGPLVEDAGSDTGWAPRTPASADPLVLVSMSTTPLEQSALIQRVLDALADAPLRVLVTLAAHLNGADFRAPANAEVVPYLRHAAVLPHVQLMISHAGLSSIGAALSFGVPLLCLPLGNEQPDNAEGVRALGAGLCLPKDADVATLRATALELLANGKYATAARQLSAALAAAGGGARAVDALERLIVRA